MALPANVGTGRVVGRFLRTVDGMRMDGPPLAGLTVTFTPSVRRVRNATAEPPVVIVLDPVTAVTNAEGVLSIEGYAQPGVTLVATDDADIDPSGFTWLVAARGPGVDPFQFHIEVPQGATVD